jgi:glycosyltransferase involved in cell wall biosynthesis
MKLSRKRALFYLTFNGVYNNNNGIGTQTKLLLEGVTKYYKEFTSQFGDFSVNIVTPIYNVKTTIDYSKQDLSYAYRQTSKTGGGVYFCPYEYSTEQFWTVDSWRTMSIGAATMVLSESSKYEESLVIAVDPPFLHTPQLIEKSKKEYGVNIKSLISMYSTSYLQDKGNYNADRLSWEYNGFTSSKIYKDIYVGSICKFITKHIAKDYGVSLDRFAPYESSLLLDSEKFKRISEREQVEILKKYNIPMNKKIIFAFGRANRIKGFDILLNEMKYVKKDIHLVLIAVKTDRKTDIIKMYKRLIKENNIDCTLITSFCSDLPKALTMWENTKIIVCPSRGEPFSNIPLEVSLWAKNEGGLLICSNIDGYTEQINHGENGYLFDIKKKGDLAEQIETVLSLGIHDSETIRRNAYDKVLKERSFRRNFAETLDFFWSN